MTAGIRPPRGSLLTISVSRSETEQWSTDEEFRTEFLRGVAKMTRERGRKFFEVYDANGRRLTVGEAS